MQAMEALEQCMKSKYTGPDLADAIVDYLHSQDLQTIKEIQGYPHKFLKAWLGTGFIGWCQFLERTIYREIIYLLQQQ